jgi:hypothetical protein
VVDIAMHQIMNCVAPERFLQKLYTEHLHRMNAFVRITVHPVVRFAAHMCSSDNPLVKSVQWQYHSNKNYPRLVSFGNRPGVARWLKAI